MTPPGAAASAPIRPGRHRSQAADEAILSATLDLLSDRGYGGFTVSAVIERAGVSSATLYRRWPTKQQLVAAAVASIAPQAPVTNTGTLEGDLAAFIAHYWQSITARREDIADALAHEVKHNPPLAAALREKFLQPRLEELDGILGRAVGRGELDGRPEADVALSLVVGPVYHRAFVLGQPLTPRFVREATGHALRGLGAEGERGPAQN
jgi:AcrR family transcriptional regulator